MNESQYKLQEIVNFNDDPDRHYSYTRGGEKAYRNFECNGRIILSMQKRLLALQSKQTKMWDLADSVAASKEYSNMYKLLQDNELLVKFIESNKYFESLLAQKKASSAHPWNVTVCQRLQDGLVRLVGDELPGLFKLDLTLNIVAKRIESNGGNDEDSMDEDRAKKPD